ncbi:MAG: hypothetical protein Q8P05_06100 [Candidatus Diapherotrites archaeon]|nr:hypothetical protein [Candidatus Diapherotrites archaeon]
MSKNSADFVKAKKLYYVEKWAVTEVNIKFENVDGNQSISATMIFEKGGKTETIVSGEPDFVDMAFNFKTLYRDGETKIIDLSSTPIKNVANLYKNVEFFKDLSKDKVRELIGEIQSGKFLFPSGFNLRSTILDVLAKRFDNEHVKFLLANYNASLALQLAGMPLWYSSYQKMKNAANDKGRFENFERIFSRVFRETLGEMPVIKAFLAKETKYKADRNLLLKNLGTEFSRHKERWDTYYKTTGGQMDGNAAVLHFLDDYANLFEIIKPSLQDMVSIVKEKNNENNISLESDNQIAAYLKQKGFSDLVDPIDPILRNGRSHYALEQIEKGKLHIYNTKFKDRKLLKIYDIQDVIDKYMEFCDFARALVITDVLNDELLLLKALDSPDFKFFVIENKT